MTRYLVDSDAWLCLRKLATLSGKTLLEAMLNAEKVGPVLIAEYAARHELSGILGEISAASQRGQVKLCQVEGKDARYRELKKRIDKGEAEALAWYLTGRRMDLAFVTRDAAALRLARELRVVATDVFGAVVDLCTLAVLSMEEAAEALQVWDDPTRENCRPRDWDGFPSAFDRRYSRGFPFF